MNFRYKWLRKRFLLSESLPTSISQYKNLKLLGSGVSGVVYAIDNKRVVKQYTEPTEIEYLAFTRIGAHPHIVKYLGSLDDGSIVLERGTLLRHVLHESYNEISLKTRVQWARDLAKSIKYLHHKRIIHADIGCHNAILVDGQLKLIDFEGCSIDGQPASSAYEWFSCRDMDLPVSMKTDIFAFGCAVYEIMSGKPPYHELVDRKDRDRYVQQLYENNQFPAVVGLPYGRLIERCWKNNLTSMTEVITELDNETSAIGCVDEAFWGKVLSTVQNFISRLRQFWIGRAWWFIQI